MSVGSMDTFNGLSFPYVRVGEDRSSARERHYELFRSEFLSRFISLMAAFCVISSRIKSDKLVNFIEKYFEPFETLTMVFRGEVDLLSGLL